MINLIVSIHDKHPALLVTTKQVNGADCTPAESEIARNLRPVIAQVLTAYLDFMQKITAEDGGSMKITKVTGHEISHGKTYVISGSQGTPSITCLKCGMTSHNPGDIREKFCGRCSIYHEFPESSATQ